VFLVSEPVAGLVAAVVPRGVAISTKVEAGTETSSGAGQDDRAASTLGSRRAQLPSQRFAQLRGHRIQLLGPV
jgi:hypothetical protein